MTDRRAALAEARRLLDGDPAAAAGAARALLKTAPGDAATLRLLGRALRRLGDDKAAAAAEHDALLASTTSDQHRAAGAAMGSGRAAEANALLNRLLAEDGDDVLALTLLGMQAIEAMDFEQAEALLRRAVELAPDEPSTNHSLAELLYQSKRPALALAALDRIGGEAAGSEPVRSLRANILGALGRLDEEVALLGELDAAAPDPLRYGLRIGHALRSLGREADAVAQYRRILAAFPAEGTAWWSLANLKTARFDASDLATIEQALAIPEMPVQNRIRLSFALGKGEEDRGDAAAAFRHYDEGNRLRAGIAPFDGHMITDWVDRNHAFLTADLFADRAGQGAAASDPIFVVGVQRSGSTLVEQILASHPAIEGTAELTDIPNLVRELGETAARHGRKFEQHLASLAPTDLQRLGERYLESSRIHRTTVRPSFTDKMPNNWMHLGLIRLILPNARIVDVRREPMACCVSNWKQLYARGLDHSNSLDTMGHYYADYVRLMRHVDAVQPGAVHRIIYEDLVEDLEGEVRRLLDYLGLPFDPACLDFHANRRAVHTISAGQVRRPINREGIDQWQKFDPWLGPLRDALGDTLNHWRD